MRRKTCCAAPTKRFTGRSGQGAIASRSHTCRTRLADPRDLDLGRHAGLQVVGWFVVATRAASGIPVELVVKRLLADPQGLRRARLVVLQPAQRRQDVLLLDLAERQPVREREIYALPSTQGHVAGQVLGVADG